MHLVQVTCMCVYKNLKMLMVDCGTSKMPMTNKIKENSWNNLQLYRINPSIEPPMMIINQAGAVDNGGDTLAKVVANFVQIENKKKR